MARLFDFVLALTISMVYISIAEANYMSWVSRCCSKGRRKASKSNDPTSCNSDDLDRRRFKSLLDRIICRHSERICCVKEIQRMSCESGKYEASQNRSCDSFRPFVGGDDFRICCDCCALGIKAKTDYDVSCSVDLFPFNAGKTSSSQCIKAFKQCCNGSVTVNPPIKIPPNPKCSDNFCRQECRDIPNEGAKCYCRSGYQLQSDRVSCQDIDECRLRDDSVCGPLEVCVNSPGSYRCVNQTEAACKKGEEKQGDSCIDKDECATREAKCPPYSTCVNTDGSYRCQCESGRILNNNKCDDVDECSNGQHSCRRGTRCENTDGSYRCAPIRQCPSGQEFNAQGQCVRKRLDICTRIQCGSGFICDRNNPRQPCQDIDECKLSPAKCKASETCINFIGTFQCRDPCKDVDCGAGLKCAPLGRSYSCLDIDECRLSLNNCTGDHEICENLYGGYNCRCRDQFTRNQQTKKCERSNACTGVSCPSGYKCHVINANNFQCKDIDECTERRSGCNQICENTAGSFVCRCRNGYQMHSNGQTCRDIDECSKGSSGCNQMCQNTLGSFVCRCRRGYELHSDGRTCRDRDECSSVRCAYRCLNTPGGYRCICPSGYNSTGYYCSDFDECEAGAKCNDDQFCFNTYGGQRCIPKLKCYTNYENMSDTRCDRRCPDGDTACYNHNKVQRYSLWTFKMRSNDPPYRIFSYRIVTYGYKKRPEVKYYFHRGNKENNFEIITRDENNGVFAYIRNRNRIKGPKIFYLEFRGDVVDNGTLASRFVHRMYVFVSRYDF